MNIQKKLYLVLTTIGIAIYGITLYSCNADEQIPNINVQTKDFSQYLHIENYLSKKVFNKAEKDILKEALYRVKKNIAQNENGMYICKTAEELNISYDIYRDLSTIIEIGNNLGVHANTHRVMKRSENAWDLDPCGWAQDYVNDYLSDKDGGEFAQECFNNYWSGTGNNMTLSSNRFEDIKKYIKKPSSPYGMDLLGKNGKTYYTQQVSFYGTPYHYSLGTATVTYDLNLNPVGLSDTYDFDPKSWGDRDAKSEAMTRAVNIVGSICDASSFKISYGVTK